MAYFKKNWKTMAMIAVVSLVTLGAVNRVSALQPIKKQVTG